MSRIVVICRFVGALKTSTGAMIWVAIERLLMRILLLEDDPDLRESLVEMLNQAGLVADGVSSIAGYRAWIRTHSCDVLIVDRNLPDGDGLDALTHFKRSTYGFAIVLSAYSEIEDRVSGFQADADLYLAKPFVFDELEAVLTSYQKRLQTVESSPTWILDPTTWILTSPFGRSVSLTRIQVALLSNFIERAGIPVTKKELIASVGGNPDYYDPKRLEAAMRRMKQKISKETGAQLPVDAIYGVGYSMKALLAKK